MTRLAPASSVRERTRRERESGSRARGTRRRRPARDATAAAAASGPVVVALLVRMVGMGRRTARATELGATLETAYAALLLTVPLALHRPHPSSAGPELGWLAAIVFTAGSGALAGMVYVSLA